MTTNPILAPSPLFCFKRTTSTTRRKNPPPSLDSNDTIDINFGSMNYLRWLPCLSLVCPQSLCYYPLRLIEFLFSSPVKQLHSCNARDYILILFFLVTASYCSLSSRVQQHVEYLCFGATVYYYYQSHNSQVFLLCVHA